MSKFLEVTKYLIQQDFNPKLKSDFPLFSS